MKNFFTPGFIFKYLILTPRVKLIKYFDSHPPGCMRANLKNSTTIKMAAMRARKDRAAIVQALWGPSLFSNKDHGKKKTKRRRNIFHWYRKNCSRTPRHTGFLPYVISFFFFKQFVSLLFVLLSVADKLQHKNIRCNSWRAARRAREPGKKNTWNAAVSKNCWQKKRSYGSHLCGNNAR